MDFYIVDVFTHNGRGGNQLAVFICDKWPSDKGMLSVARELDFAEVTFLKKSVQQDKFDMRIFTVNYELPFAGHPTIGAAWVARNRFGIEGNNLVMGCKIGDIPIE